MSTLTGGRRRRAISAALLALVACPAAVLASRGAPPAPGPNPARVELVKTPNGGIQPQAVADPRGKNHLLYYSGDARGGDLFYVVRELGQTSWSKPVRVNSEPGSAVAAGTIRGGQLALGKNGRAHVVWFGSANASQKGPEKSAPLLYSRLNDAKTGFEPQRNLMQFTSALDGGPSVAADSAGNVYAAWHGAETPGGGEVARRLWVARSKDDGKTFSREAAANSEPTGACACCGAKAFADSRGTLYVLYRSATEKVDRDIYLLTSTTRGEQFQGRRLDRWKINACPMSSEALVESPSGVLAAWETNGQVSYAEIDPKTLKASPPVSPPGGGGRKHPSIARNARGETLLAWAEGTGWQRGGAVAWQLFDRAGRPVGERGRLEGGIPAWSLPTVVARPDGGFTLFH